VASWLRGFVAAFPSGDTPRRFVRTVISYYQLLSAKKEVERRKQELGRPMTKARNTDRDDPRPGKSRPIPSKKQ